jgi:S-formylglutathione hydrolase
MRTIAGRIRMTAAIVGLLLAARADAQLPASSVAGQLVEIRINSSSLKGNLLGDPAEQRVVVYLPPSYATSPAKRFPVIYLLHGYTGTVESWTTNGYQRMNLRVVMDELIKKGTANEMIVVVPNGSNRYLGSFYTNSSVNGNWEDYIYRDVVSFIDDAYRTITKPASRGIAGHSMGGYGAISLAMRHPDVFGAVYALSPCCLGMEADLSSENPAWRKTLKTTTSEIYQRPPQSFEDFFVAAFIAASAAFTPDPNNAGLKVSFPYKETAGRLLPNEPAYSAFRSKMPLYLVEQYRDSFLKLRGIFIDVGQFDEFSHIRIASHAFSAELAAKGIPHTFEMYEGGDHSNKIRERFEQHVVPFFARVLEF